MCIRKSQEKNEKEKEKNVIRIEIKKIRSKVALLLYQKLFCAALTPPSSSDSLKPRLER